MRQKLHYISTIAVCYVLTIGTLGILLQRTFVQQTPTTHTQLAIPAPTKHPAVQPITGTPARIVIPSYGIDLQIIPGEYDATNGTWTLSDTQAQFATMSNPANNTNGNTFVYGHGTDAVFGKLGAQHPTPGTTLELYTNNGNIFTYAFREVHDFTPTDTTIFDNVTSGAPRLTVQTCTGAWSEWRTMFTFDYQSVRRA